MGNATSDPRPGWNVTSLRLTDDEHSNLKRIAAHDRRSLSNELRWLIAQRVDEVEAELKAAA